jgi:hypothetical protein
MKIPKKEIYNYQKWKKNLKKEIYNYQKRNKKLKNDEITKKGNGLKGKVFPKKEIFSKKSEKIRKK